MEREKKMEEDGRAKKREEREGQQETDGEEGERMRGRKTCSKKSLTLYSHLERLRDHVVDQPVLVPDPLGLERVLVLRLVDLLEDLHEPPVVLFQDGVFRRQVERPPLGKRKLEARLGEAPDRRVRVEHREPDARGGVPLELVHVLDHGLAPSGGLEHQRQRPGLRHDHVLAAVLVPVRVPADDDGLLPARDEAGDVGDDDGLAVVVFGDWVLG